MLKTIIAVLGAAAVIGRLILFGAGSAAQADVALRSRRRSQPSTRITARPAIRWPSPPGPGFQAARK